LNRILEEYAVEVRFLSKVKDDVLAKPEAEFPVDFAKGIDDRRRSLAM
jgi:hypothetical protein